MRTPFLVFVCDVPTGCGEVGAAGAASTTCRTALRAGVLARNNSSAPGKLALRVIGRLLWRLVLWLGGDKTVRHLKMMRMR